MSTPDLAGSRVAAWVGLAAAALATACAEPTEARIPSAEEVVGYYVTQAGIEAEINGNVATIYVEQEAAQIRRGGTLWAKLGPYVFLFTDETRRLFEDFTGLAAVRVVTRVGGVEVARALLNRGALSSVQWQRALNIAGRARLDGSQQMTLLEDLVDWGESHTAFEYNPRYTRR